MDMRWGTRNGLFYCPLRMRLARQSVGVLASTEGVR